MNGYPYFSCSREWKSALKKFSSERIEHSSIHSATCRKRENIYDGNHAWVDTAPVEVFDIGTSLKEEMEWERDVTRSSQGEKEGLFEESDEGSDSD